MVKKNKIVYSKRIINIFNVSLTLISLLLLLNLFNVPFPNIGYSIYDTLSHEEPTCFISYQSGSNEISMSHCCNQARKQLSCGRDLNVFNNKPTDITCKTGDSSIKYHLNNNAYQFCKSKDLI